MFPKNVNPYIKSYVTAYQYQNFSSGKGEDGNNCT